MAQILNSRTVIVDDEAPDEPPPDMEMVPAHAPPTTDAEEEELRAKPASWAELFMCCGDDADSPAEQPALHHTDVLLDDDLFEKEDGTFVPKR